MNWLETVDQIEYPESDGQPISETDVHRDWMVRILEILRHRYEGRQVYLAADLLLYYVEGTPYKFVVPDVFVVKDCDPGPRRIFKTWEEGKSPDVVFEVTSRSTRREDEVYKPQTYAQLGVKEYFLYDPTAEYLKPPLQGYCLDDGGGFARIEPDAEGGLASNELGIVLRLGGQDLVLIDAQTGETLPTGQEAAEAAAEAAEARADRLEKEVERLKVELKRAGKRDDEGK